MSESYLKSRKCCTIACVIVSLACLFLLQSEVQAARKKEKKQDTPQLPISIFADYIHYDNETGDIFAEGNVRVVQNDQTLLAEKIYGNVNTADIWTKTETRFKEVSTQSDFTGDYAEYNYESKTGHIFNVNGKSGSEFITADTVEILPEKLIGQNIMMTRCNAKEHTKCQHTTATRVDIWPNDRMIAYDANVYILGTKIHHQSRYVTSLGGGKSQIPKIGYDDDNGLYLKHTIAFPLGKKTTMGANLFAGTEIGGRTMGWLRQDETNFDVAYAYGYQQDDDNEWIKKEHNIRIDYQTKQLFKTPLYYRFWFERGRWSDKYKTSWHSEAGAYLSHAPIYIGSKSFYMTLGTGYRKLKESYLSVDQNEYRYDIGLTKKFNKWEISTLYSNVENNVSLFSYNSIDVAESLNTTISWRPDSKNTLSYYREYDVAHNRLFKHRLTYVRNLHCWDLVIYFERERQRYLEPENKIHWELHLAI